MSSGSRVESKWRAEAPSNIALIKYMGKIAGKDNVAANSSLSMTLPHLRSVVELELTTGEADRWEPLSEPELYPIELSEKSIVRFLSHLQMLKKQFDFAGVFVVRSANNFPSDCGLASSASSFAALTVAAMKALAGLHNQEIKPNDLVANLSRMGSGSSCRSFYGPWCMWSGEKALALGRDLVTEVELPYPELLHQVVVVEGGKKAVPSSEAHRRVITSLLFNGRPERAELRLSSILTALRTRNWVDAFEIAWAEFWDMHALFGTSRPTFGYMTHDSMAVLDYVRHQVWEVRSDGPIVTMDAGANVHLIYRSDQEDLAREIEGQFSNRFKIVNSWAL